MALGLSSAAKIAAAALTAATLIGGAFAANAQQMARTSELDYSACDRMHQTNPKGAIQCRLDVIRASGAQARRETAAAEEGIRDSERDIVCARQLRELRTNDPTVVERGRAILAGRPLQTFGVCNLLGALTRS